VPVYEFGCPACGAQVELILPLGDNGPRPCDGCGGRMRQRLSRVAVKYGSWGFTATDSLVGDARGKDFKALRAKAEQISDE
jgi:putative FmdB family regulatory protein